MPGLASRLRYENALEEVGMAKKFPYRKKREKDQLKAQAAARKARRDAIIAARKRKRKEKKNK